MPKAVGIDLGTTNSVVSVLEGGDPVVIPNAEGSRTTPSVVAFAKDGEVLVGEVAKRQAITNPERTIRSVKRHVGTNWSIDIDGKAYNSQEISARTLMKLKRDAEEYLGDTVTQAVITVPAYFDDAQRTATQEAGAIAGLEVLRIINEPTAAALAYGLDKETEDQTILVFDLGGGTFDVSVLELGDGVFEVKSTSGDTNLGGDDWDEAIIDWLAETFQGEHGVDLRKDPMAAQRLKEAAEKAKIELSQTTSTQINMPYVTATDAGPLHLDYELTRAKFQDLTSDLLTRTRKPFEAAIKDAGLTKGEIDHVVLVGGSTRMPAVAELVNEMTGKEPNKTVNPDEVVAVGAAIQGGVLAGEVKDILLLDVTPLSLGVETLGGVMTKMINRNTTVPTKKTETYSTAVDGQTNVEIHVLQGEREMASDNKSLGTFRLDGIPPAPRGVPQIEVTFDIDANGILSVTAKDKGSGKEQSISITGASTLSDSEVDKMVKDAEANASADKEKREKIDLKNQAETLVYQAEKQMGELGDKVDADAKAKLEEKRLKLKEATEKDDYDAMKTLLEELQQELYTVGASVYQQEGAAAGAGAPGADAGAGANADGGDASDDVIDAEFTETK